MALIKKTSSLKKHVPGYGCTASSVEKHLEMLVQEACDEELKGILKPKHIDAIRTRLRTHPHELNKSFQFGVTALHTACCMFAPCVLKFLLSYNPKINIENRLGETAFMRMRKMKKESDSRTQKCMDLMGKYFFGRIEKDPLLHINTPPPPTKCLPNNMKVGNPNSASKGLHYCEVIQPGQLKPKGESDIPATPEKQSGVCKSANTPETSKLNISIPKETGPMVESKKESTTNIKKSI